MRGHKQERGNNFVNRYQTIIRSNKNSYKHRLQLLVSMEIARALGIVKQTANYYFILPI